MVQEELNIFFKPDFSRANSFYRCLYSCFIHHSWICVLFRFTSPRFTSPRFTSPRFTSPRFTSPRFTSPRFTSPRFSTPRFTSTRFTSPRFTSLRFTTPVQSSPRFTSPRFTSLRFTSPVQSSPVHEISYAVTARSFWFHRRVGKQNCVLIFPGKKGFHVSKTKATYWLHLTVIKKKQGYNFTCLCKHADWNKIGT